MTEATWTISRVLAATKDYLERSRLDSPRLEAELLMAHALSVSRLDLYLDYERPLSESERSAVRQAIRRRVGGEPIQYITGFAAFRHLVLKVTPAVLIPRPETELLVDAVIKRIKLKRGPLAVLDLGTGSGAIALSIAHELEQTRVWASDISPAALAVARENARRCGLEDRVKFFESDLLAGVRDHTANSFDVIVANPPYVRSGDLGGLAPEVRDREPAEALDGGPDGLAFYRRIIAGVGEYLAADGLVAFEVGAGQARTVADWLEKAAYVGIELEPDYAGIERIVSGIWPPSS